jgi:3-oxoacyl-[acyl-carrier protein] reductase
LTSTFWSPKIQLSVPGTLGLSLPRFQCAAVEVPTPPSIAHWESYREDGDGAILERIATRRLGEPEDIANGVLFFVSGEASWVTGQVISIDGGHSIF